MLASCTLPWTRGSSQRSSASEAPTTAPLGSNLNLEDERNDSAFCEPEYSNPASFESTSPDLEDHNNDYQNNIVARRMLKLNITADQDSDFVPDYEEVDPVQVQQLRQSLRRHSMHKDMIFHHNVNFRNESLNKSMDKNSSHNETASSTTTERIMQSLIYCIHKVSQLMKKEYYGTLFSTLFWPTVRKNCSSD